MTHRVRLTGSTETARPLDGGGQARHIGDAEVGDPRELLDLHALDRVDVGLARAPGGDA